MRWLLDTNIISIAKPTPSEPLLAWMAEQEDTNPCIGALTVADHRGVLEKPAGKRRDQLQAWFDGPEGPQALFAGRVLAFDEAAALIWGRLMAAGKAKNQPRSALDMMAAAVAEANSCTVVTGNEKDFAGIETVNPFRKAILYLTYPAVGVGFGYRRDRWPSPF